MSWRSGLEEGVLSDIIDSICLAHIILMKSFKQEMENQADQDDFDPEDILKAFRQLQQSQPQLPAESLPDPSPPKQQQQPAKAPLPKKTCIIRKQSSRHLLRQKPSKPVNQNSLGRLSNFSSIGPYDESEVTQRQQMQQEVANRPSDDMSSSEMLINSENEAELRQLQEQEDIKKQQYDQELLRERKQSYQKKILYSNYLNFCDNITSSIVDKQIASHELIEQIQKEQAGLKIKKSRKGNHDQQEKMLDVMMKQKKAYLSGLAAKLHKQQQKYGSVHLGQFRLKVADISEDRVTELRKIQQLACYQILCHLQKANPNQQEIMCMNLTTIQEVVLTCYHFNPTTPKTRRQELSLHLKHINSMTKKLTSPSSNLFFPNKSSLFLPVRDIFSSDDEILIANDKIDYQTTLNKYLQRVGFSSGEQGLYLLRYLVRSCLKCVEEINQYLPHMSAVFTPTSICLNQKFQFRFKNVLLNQFLFKQFRHLFLEDQICYFPPEQKPEPSAVVLWSLGILSYQLFFGCKPFQKYQPYSWSSRQYFLTVNELQIPQKSATSQKLKDFITLCLKKRVSPQTLQELSNEVFLSGPVR